MERKFIKIKLKIRGEKMTEKIKENDFIELDYTGKLEDGSVFDTTEEKVAKDNGFYKEKMKFGPATICVGENQILPGLDKNLIDQELGKEFEVKLSAGEAFGKRDIKKMKIMPVAAFKEHNMQPQPGLQIEADGETGTITRVSGGRVIVNFNHPLAGKEVTYVVKVNKKITDPKEQIITFLSTSMRMPKDKINVTVNEEKAEIKLPMQLPEQFTDAVGKKLVELTKLKEVKFVAEKKEPVENVVAETNENN
jgi:FKBP-type peptidyl-prolyl cis-trans isomerase 2